MLMFDHVRRMSLDVYTMDYVTSLNRAPMFLNAFMVNSQYLVPESGPPN